MPDYTGIRETHVDHFSLSRAIAEHLSAPAGTFPVSQSRTFRSITVSTHRLSRGTWRWLGGEDPGWIMIWVPDELLTGLGFDVGNIIVSGKTCLVAAAQAFITAALRTPQHRDTEPDAEAHVMERLLLGLVIGVIMESGVADPLPHRTISQIERAHSLILAHLRDPDFTVESLAQHLNMSERSVQRMFAQFGTTPSQVLRQFRAKLAESMLRDEDHASVTEISTRAGFRSVSAMRRALSATGEDRSRSATDFFHFPTGSHHSPPKCPACDPSA